VAASQRRGSAARDTHPRAPSQRSPPPQPRRPSAPRSRPAAQPYRAPGPQGAIVEIESFSGTSAAMIGSGFSRRPVLRVRLMLRRYDAYSVFYPSRSSGLISASGSSALQSAHPPHCLRAHSAACGSAARARALRCSRLRGASDAFCCERNLTAGTLSLSLSLSLSHTARALAARSRARRSLAVGAEHPRARSCGAPRSQKLSLRLTPAAERGLMRCAARHHAAQQARARGAEGCQPTPPPLASSPTIAARAAPAARARRRRPQLWGASGASPRASDGARALSGSRAALPSSTRRAS
jgi:hypothetical protein